MNKFITWIQGSKLLSLFLLVVFYYMVASASHYGFFNKWALVDRDDLSFNYIRIMDGTGPKPYIYRQLIPQLSKLAQTIVPDSLQDKILTTFVIKSYYTSTVKYSDRPGYAFAYSFHFFMSFLGLFCSLFLLRSLLLDFKSKEFVATIAPAIFILFFQYIETIGGYYYDSIELAFFAAAVLLARRGHIVALLLLAAPATMNKESFFFFIPALYPFLREKVSQKRTVASLAAALFLSGTVNAISKYIYMDNSGGMAVFQLFKNLRAYLDPWNYLDTSVTYGMPSPGGASIVTLLVIAIISIRGWHRLDSIIQRHILIAGTINLPLFLAFCHPGELRNLSMLYVGFVMMMAETMRQEKGSAAGERSSIE